MKVLALLMLAWLYLPRMGWAAENRRVAWEPVATFGWEADLRNIVRFTTTTTSANVQVCVVSTHTAQSLTVPSNVTYEPVQTSSTTNTWGGRSYSIFQVVATGAATDHVNVDYGTVSLSTTTSPYLTVGQWFSPDDPVANQGPVCLMSPSTFTVTGWYWEARPR